MQDGETPMAIARSEAVKAVLKEAEEIRASGVEAAGEKQAEEAARKVRFSPHLYIH